ncbi:RDD family protein [Algibacter mikhailovii]|uniref:RDD family protein n=1 Tax=Algibacter mikhailovii TaxID=425498 RepID=UPI0024951B0B|nr:RDD family protein [Algibacter mikhailovii]
MTREERLRYGKTCKNQKFDMSQGIICSLTNQPADFRVNCSTYFEDSELKQKEDYIKAEKEILNKTASQGKRFANYLIDLVFLMIFSFIFGAILGIVLAIISPSSLSIFEENNKLIDYLFGFITGMIYYSILETTTGKTIAKFITKTKVVNEAGEKPDFGTILIRSLSWFIPFEAFSFLGSVNSGWHDKLSKTRVIQI